MIRSLLRRDPAERIASEDLLLHPWMKHDDRRDHSPPSSATASASTSAHSSAASMAYQRSLSSASDQCVPEVIFASDGEDDEDGSGSSSGDVDDDSSDAAAVGIDYGATRRR